MPVSLNSQLGSKEHFDTLLANKIMSSMKVAMPGIIQSFDPDTVTCTAILAVKGDENSESSNSALLVDVPVVFPRGGGCTLTFPVKAGDECLLIFSDRCIDFWWQSGGVQEPVDTRQHDLSDAFAIVGPQSQAKKISGISMAGAQLRTDDGAAYVEVATGHNITVQTPGKLTANAQGGTEITSPEIKLTGNVIVTGDITASGEISGKGKILSSHTHSGVEKGNDNTGAPV